MSEFFLFSDVWCIERGAIIIFRHEIAFVWVSEFVLDTMKRRNHFARTVERAIKHEHIKMPRARANRKWCSWIRRVCALGICFIIWPFGCRFPKIRVHLQRIHIRRFRFIEMFLVIHSEMSIIKFDVFLFLFVPFVLRTQNSPIEKYRCWCELIASMTC